jgi:hypothetical protein
MTGKERNKRAFEEPTKGEVWAFEPSSPKAPQNLEIRHPCSGSKFPVHNVWKSEIRLAENKNPGRDENGRGSEAVINNSNMPKLQRAVACPPGI